MKRTITLLLVLGLLVGATMGVAEAKKKKKVKRVERTAELTYQCPCGPSTPAGSQGVWAGPDGSRLGGGPVPSGVDDKFVKVEVADQSGGDVYVELAQDTDGDLQSETEIGSVCSSTDEALAVPSPGTDVTIYVYEGTCGTDGGPAVATTGTVTLTFSNLP